MKKILLLFLLALANTTSYGQAGTLDRSFGNQGIVRTDFNGANSIYTLFSHILAGADESLYIVSNVRGEYDERSQLVTNYRTVITHRFSDSRPDSAYGIKGHAVPVPLRSLAAILQPDGKIILAGYSLVNKTIHFTLYRFKTNGLLDESFSGDGKQTTDFSGLSDRITTLALQNDGKIVAAGISGGTLAIARYHTDGSLDNSFSGDGKFTSSFSVDWAGARAIQLQDNGNITVAATSADTVKVVHLLADGRLDNTFGDGGKKMLPLPFVQPIMTAFIQQNGKVLVGGFSGGPDTGFTLVRLNEDVTLDPQFSDDGIQINNLGDVLALPFVIAEQADGKILAAGFRDVNHQTDLLLVRYNVDGSLDNSFSEDGFDSRDVNPFNEIASSMVITKNGKILMAGEAMPFMFVLKYNKDGSLDPNFDRDGIFVDDILKHGGQAYISASAIQPDGKIIVAGAGTTALDSLTRAMRIVVGRFNPDGQIDSSFSGDGKRVILFTDGNNEVAKDVVIQPDGKIIIVGYASNGSNFDFAVARFNPDGIFDSSFSSDGKLLVDFDNGWDQANDVCLQPDGKILVAGTNGSDFVVARLNSDGTLDHTFSVDGKLVVDVGSVTDKASKVMVQPDGKILVAGEYGNSSNTYKDFAVLRFNGDGTADPSFGINGKVITDLYGGLDYVSSAILQPDGKIIVAGSTIRSSDLSGMDFAVVRYNSNGSLDNNFSIDGKLQLNVQSTSEGATSLALQPDQKIVVAGFTNGKEKSNFTIPRSDHGDLAILRVNADGTLDENFGSRGFMVQDYNSGEDGIESISIWKNRIYAVGKTTYLGELGFIAAYIMNGSNKPPIAGAWFQKYYNPTSALLAAWDSKDPEGGPITYLWRKSAGPEGSGLLYSNSASPVVTGLVKGTYIFRLTVTDNQGDTGTASVSFTVPENFPPIAGAWLQKYYSPTSVLLAAWDSHDPEGGPITYLWERTAGPEGSTLLYWNSASPVVNGLVNGTYTYRLTVTDNEGATGAKELTFTVSGAALNGNTVKQSLSEVSTHREAGQFTIYPNPVTELLSFRWRSDYNGKALVTVMDISGKKLQSLHFHKSTIGFYGNMEVSKLKPGQYYLHITNGNKKIMTISFMKQ
jgi:uncharacterized delta-60 repeat protein